MKQEKEQSNAYQKLIRLACQSGANVLISGATGTGKTRLAKQIHDGSTRKTAPFVTVNLATLHEGVLESELFGHERGSFTGAEQRRTGKLEMAQGGTVFLDEIGELPLRLQARLLEFLQSKTITPVGSNREVRLDVRVIVATHRDLERAVQKSEFREDLFHRLRVISISLECLRNRSDDFDAILQTNLHDLCISAKKPAMRLNSEVMTRFKMHSWPGNIRELRNVLEFAVLASDGGEITLADLPEWMSPVNLGDQHPQGPSLIDPGTAGVPISLDFQGTMAKFEKDYLKRALEKNGGRINRTARQIGMNKTTLLRRIRVHQILAGNELLDQQST